jgi:hypothetical protein
MHLSCPHYEGEAMPIKAICLTACVICLTASSVVGASQEATKTNQPADPPSKALANDPRLAAVDAKAREKVLKEVDQAKPYCEENVTLGNFYECDCFARKVFDQRLKTGTEVETVGSATRPASGEFKVPLAAMIGDKDFSTVIASCASPSKVEAWGKKRASGFPDATESRSTCIGQQLAARFKQKPVADMGYIQRMFSEVMSSCQGR